MEYIRFLRFSVLGKAVWGIGVSLLGYYLGSAFGNIEGVDCYLTLLVLAFFFIPGLPTVIHVWYDNHERIVGWVRERLSREHAPENQLQHRLTQKRCVHRALR